MFELCKKPYLWLIRAVGVIVPRSLRANWRREWEAELRHREEMLAEWERLDWRTKLDLSRRSTRCFKTCVTARGCWRKGEALLWRRCCVLRWVLAQTLRSSVWRARFCGV